MLVDYISISINDLLYHVAFEVVPIVSNGLETIGMLGNSDLNSSPHWQAFNAIFRDIIAHFLHVGWDIHTLFTKGPVSPVSWNIP